MKTAVKFLVLTAMCGWLCPSQASAGLFKMDFGTLQNDEFGNWFRENGEEVEFPGELEDWDEFPTFSFFDFDVQVAGLDAAAWELTDWSDDGDDDVILTIFDQEEIAEEAGGAFANGMIHNNPVPQFEDVVYDGIDVPMQVKDDYLYRDPDTANTELLFRFANLNPGQYNLTLFEGRTTDAPGQFAKVWVESGETGAAEPEEENTGNFAGNDPFTGEINPLGNPVTIPIEISAGEFLWYAHMEDNQGGISGIIIRQTDTGGEPGDFDGSGVLDADDIEALSAEVRAGTNNTAFDVTADGIVDGADRDTWVRDLRKTWFGDSNMDGEFNSSDFVFVFTQGEYEDGVAGNSTWADGDWNGDTEFSSSDFVKAFTEGGYEQGPRPLAAVAAVPEPSSVILLAVGLLIMARTILHAPFHNAV